MSDDFLERRSSLSTHDLNLDDFFLTSGDSENAQKKKIKLK